ncbi:MAG: DNA polymerase IV [Clostridia bacterium]|nr:DNA polymerase IV [Clostridia bacterium]
MKSRERIILHCDCNSFFASVETALNPAYKGVPMAVCGSVEDRHGIVLAKNELAKKYGIQTAETVISAKRKCPTLVIASPHYEEYVKYSRRVNEIYAEFTDMIEPFGIDESWLDVTASVKLFGDGRTIADKIRERVKKEVGITVSVGVSFNKVFAKLGSDYKKPDAVTVIDRTNYKEVAYPLPVRDLLFVGGKTAAALFSMGIRTIGDLAETDVELLKMRFGKMGETLKKYASGADDSPVSGAGDPADAKSIGNGFTFRHDLVTREECRTGIEFLSEEIGYKLRKRGLKCSGVQLTVKDEYLRSVQRQKQLTEPSDISREIAGAAYDLLLANWSAGKPVRMLTVTAIGLIKADCEVAQIGFFDDDEAKDVRRGKSKKREETVDKIRQKYGNKSIISASVIESDIGIYEKPKKDGGK